MNAKPDRDDLPDRPGERLQQHGRQLAGRRARRPAAMMAKWVEFATPGEAHKALAPKVGRWNLKGEAFNPGQPPEESLATSEVKWIMDGRFLQDTTSGTARPPAFAGMGLAGYDNLKKQYFSTWMDNMGTGVMVSTGHYDPASKTFTTRGRCPTSWPASTCPRAASRKWIDNDPPSSRCTRPTRTARNR
jgi:hypothetical protein